MMSSTTSISLFAKALDLVAGSMARNETVSSLAFSPHQLGLRLRYRVFWAWSMRSKVNGPVNHSGLNCFQPLLNVSGVPTPSLGMTLLHVAVQSG